MSDDLVKAIAKRFIARPDAKAKQYPNGEYKPVRKDGRHDGPTLPWRPENISDHLAGVETFGHYFLDIDSTTKLFALDIDLEKEGRLPTESIDPETATEESIRSWEDSFVDCDPRAAWRERANPAREFMKIQFRELAGMLASIIHDQMELECAVAYSGNKGIHVYGFLEKRDTAQAARDGAEIVLDLMGGWKLQDKRASTYKHDRNWRNLSIEVYPKQVEIESGGFGNLMRLPLGINTKAPKDPTFFVDLNAPMNQLQAADPLWSLTVGAKNPWAV